MPLPYDDWLMQGWDTYYDSGEDVCDCVTEDGEINPNCALCNGTGFIQEVPNPQDDDD